MTCIIVWYGTAHQIYTQRCVTLYSNTHKTTSISFSVASQNYTKVFASLPLNGIRKFCQWLNIKKRRDQSARFACNILKILKANVCLSEKEWETLHLSKHINSRRCSSHVTTTVYLWITPLELSYIPTIEPKSIEAPNSSTQNINIAAQIWLKRQWTFSTGEKICRTKNIGLSFKQQQQHYWYINNIFPFVQTSLRMPAQKRRQQFNGKWYGLEISAIEKNDSRKVPTKMQTPSIIQGIWFNRQILANANIDIFMKQYSKMEFFHSLFSAWT